MFSLLSRAGMFAAALILIFSLTTTESRMFYLGKLFSCGGKQLPKDVDETQRPHRAGPASTSPYLHAPHILSDHCYDDRQSGARRSAKERLVQAAAVENVVQAASVEKVHAAQAAACGSEQSPTTAERPYVSLRSPRTVAVVSPSPYHTGVEEAPPPKPSNSKRMIPRVSHPFIHNEWRPPGW